ncbi:hypothetical protein Hden_1207 [Hyphomicrobium denitrificans ATCC 51888]|uniref:Uncharacterized protein n=1 Tax=Hyphomicrobium denitrificans (strain ATCC 51888 / DSM 1869 / NCIMB 11706 / TK 0415) TaxID=582899 RepID=D8JWA6_HYPDA|nr:hypothetical protein [Hyphomicrobium denitrificans]ADJ23019.1 hypothetical protein Hden_1207 [Hyphomicrobium denitrificans ATCC 51888]
MTQATTIESMIDKAAAAEKSDDALKFSQAALNAANAMRTMADMPKE